MSEAAKWYVIHTYSGYENKVAENIERVVENRKLHDLILEVKVPTEKVTEITDGKTKEVERKTYPGYVLPDLRRNLLLFRKRKSKLWELKSIPFR